MTPFTPSFDADSDAVWDVEDEHPMDMAALASRIQTVREADAVQERLEALPCAWVLVFDADTEDEAVYSMELASDPDAHVVLAFEDRTEAEAYALALSSDPLEDGYDAVASVQGLDVEALVVTSRDADFKVGVVFGGDLLSGEVDSRSSSSSSMGGGSGLSASAPMITGGVASGLGSLYPSSPPPSVSISITMVPDACFEGRTADDFLDPTEDPVWVLVHDEGTGDAQLFSMALNGTASVICFKDEEAADRCSTALRLKGSAQASAHALYLEDLLERMGDDDMEVRSTSVSNPLHACPSPCLPLSMPAVCDPAALRVSSASSILHPTSKHSSCCAYRSPARSMDRTSPPSLPCRFASSMR